jgi:hypothetical protein
MRVLGFARTRRDHPHVDAYLDQAGLPAALGEADVVCVALALTRETQHLVDAAALAAMKPTACLVNVARGELLWTSRHSWPRFRSQPGLLRGRTPAGGAPALAPAERPDHASLAPGSDGFWAHYANFLAENIRRFGDAARLLGVVDRAAGY